MDTYLDFCKRCSQGKVEYSKDFYILSDKYSNNKDTEQSTDILIVNPTQAAVDQAKSEVKNKKTINKVKKENITRLEVRVERRSRSGVRKKWLLKKIKNQGLPRRIKKNPTRQIKKERLEKML